MRFPFINHGSRRKQALTFFLLAPLWFQLSAAPIDESKLPPPAKITVEFDRDIRPIFENSCLRCHGPEKPKNRFCLDNRESALKGGDNGVDIVPGNSAKSPLIHYVSRLVEEMEMPPTGKGEPLTVEQVGLLRAWIDQGAIWGATNPAAQLAFSIGPAFRWIDVAGNVSKFREVEGIREDFSSGLEYFSMSEQIGRDKKISVEGHALFPDDDVQVKLALEKSDVGFIHAGFEQWRRYYDDTGGHHPLSVPPAFDLNRDLHLDIGRAWIDFGLALPNWPRIVLGYEYQFRRGDKSTLEWGSASGKNIYPAARAIDEETHIIKLDVTHDFAGWHLENSARVEFYNQNNRGDQANIFLPGTTPDTFVHTSERHRHVQGMNSLLLEKQLYDWWFLSGGYYYSRLEAENLFNQTTTDAANVPIFGNFWSSDPIMLRRESHIFSAANLFTPVEFLSISVGTQNEWTHQEGFGDLHLDLGDPNVPFLFFLFPASVRSDLDKFKAMQNANVRFTKIPFTVLFADARFEQESIGQFEQETGNVPQTFLRDTDAANLRRDLRIGFDTSPWRWLNLGAHYRNRSSDSDYDHLRDVSIVGEGYSAFIRHRKIQSEEVEAKLVLRPLNWLKTTLTYKIAASDFSTKTDSVLLSDPFTGDIISPGGGISAGNYDAHVYGVNVTLTPWQRFYFSGTFSYSDSRTATAQNGVSSIVPYEGDIYTVLASANYTLNESTSLQAGYSFSQADYGQNNPDGVPLGLNYTRHGVMFGVTKRITEHLSTNLRYGFFHYAEPGRGGANDYVAHAIFATVVVKWP